MTRPTPATVMTADHRRERRHAAVLMIGKVTGPRGSYACVVHNISRSGLKARFPHPPTVGERLTLGLRGAPDMPATVRWAQDLLGGVEFDQRLDLAAILGSYGSARLPRAPRFACDRRTTLVLAGRDRPIGLIDVSLGGAKLGHVGGEAPLPGQVGRLLLPFLAERRVGIVRWQEADRLGFQFAEPLSLDALATMLSQRTAWSPSGER